MKNTKQEKSLFNYFENKLNLELNNLNFRFPVETLDTLLKKYYKNYEESAFLVQAGKSITNLSLRKISKSFLLQVPLSCENNEQLYIGISDYFSFLILFDEDTKEQNIKDQYSKFFLTFDSELIRSIFNFFYKQYCQSLTVKEKKLLIKLKNIKMNQLDPYYISKFQQELLINALSSNNKAKQAKIIEAISFTDESIAISDIAGNIKETNKNFKNTFQDKKSIKEFLTQELYDSAIAETNKKQRWQSEVNLQTKDNKSELLQISCYLFKDELSRPNGYVFTFKNITELKRLDHVNKQLISKLRERNMQLSEVNKRLVEADRIKSDLLSVISHELKTPISTIIGFSELIVNREYDEVTTKNYADEITSSAKKLDRLITDYLDVASNQFGVSKDKLYSMPVNLSDLIRICYQEERFKFDQINTTLELNSLGYEPIIITEAENMRKLFGNLLNNCLKYSPNGGKISVKLLNDSENVTVSIADQGIGLTLDQAKQVFEPFYRADNSVTREFSGIGLGLAVSRKIVELYNGSIWCEPGVDLGSVFYVTLPVNPHKLTQKEIPLQIQELEILEGKQELHDEKSVR